MALSEQSWVTSPERFCSEQGREPEPELWPAPLFHIWQAARGVHVPAWGLHLSLGTHVAPSIPLLLSPATGHRHQAMNLLDLGWLSWCLSCEEDDTSVKTRPKCYCLRKKGLCAFLQQHGLFACCLLCSPTISDCCPGQILCKITPFTELFFLSAPHPYFVWGCTNIWHNTNSDRKGSDKTGIDAFFSPSDNFAFDAHQSTT